MLCAAKKQASKRDTAGEIADTAPWFFFFRSLALAFALLIPFPSFPVVVSTFAFVSLRALTPGIKVSCRKTTPTHRITTLESLGKKEVDT